MTPHPNRKVDTEQLKKPGTKIEALEMGESVPTLIREVKNLVEQERTDRTNLEKGLADFTTNAQLIVLALSIPRNEYEQLSEPLKEKIVERNEKVSYLDLSEDKQMKELTRNFGELREHYVQKQAENIGRFEKMYDDLRKRGKEYKKAYKFGIKDHHFRKFIGVDERVTTLASLDQSAFPEVRDVLEAVETAQAAYEELGVRFNNTLRMLYDKQFRTQSIEQRPVHYDVKFFDA